MRKEASFCLDLFWDFFVSRQKSTKSKIETYLNKLKIAELFLGRVFDNIDTRWRRKGKLLGAYFGIVLNITKPQQRKLPQRIRQFHHLQIAAAKTQPN